MQDVVVETKVWLLHKQVASVSEQLPKLALAMQLVAHATRKKEKSAKHQQ